MCLKRLEVAYFVSSEMEHLVLCLWMKGNCTLVIVQLKPLLSYFRWESNVSISIAKVLLFLIPFSEMDFGKQLVPWLSTHKSQLPKSTFEFRIALAKSFGFEVKICKQTADWTSFTCFYSEDLVVKRGKHRAWLIIDLSTYTNEWQMAQHSSENVIFRTRKFVQVTFKKHDSIQQPISQNIIG